MMLKSFHNAWIRISVAVLILALAPSVAAAEVGSGSAQAPLNVLILSSSGPEWHADGIKQLLERHGVAVTIERALSSVTAREFDLIIIGYGATFPGRNTPVLGYGRCGCAHFGSMDLKNGRPFT